MSTSASESLDLAGRSLALLRSGKQYGNEYCFMMRFRDRKLSEYREYFNPPPAIAAFAPPDSNHPLGG
jgi:ketosteroid isomerase-like protein